MKKEVILSGFGGQGVMSIGKNLVEAAVEDRAQELDRRYIVCPKCGEKIWL